ncbi:MAG: hypothetical protein U9Q06_01995 [Nanoarchaeota archaeon]|nr:hypothetical protein [Nanoarchaeota archaeon]
MEYIDREGYAGKECIAKEDIEFNLPSASDLIHQEKKFYWMHIQEPKESSRIVLSQV